MKTRFLLTFITASLLFFVSKTTGQINNPVTVAKTDASNQINSNMNGLNSAANKLKGLFGKKKKMTQNQPAINGTAAATPSDTATTGQPSTADTSIGRLTSYQNYDFVPGNNILFEDEFTDDQSGEFPAHWNLTKGQGILNMAGTEKAFYITDGATCWISPLMKNNSYLTANFSIEYDTYGTGGAPLDVEIDNPNNDYMTIEAGNHEVDWSSYRVNAHGTQNSALLPSDIADANYKNKWHHIAIAYKNNQMKVYVDKYRVLIIPRCNGVVPASLQLYGHGVPDNRPVIFKNFKIADGAQMYMTGQKFTDAKIVTHGINFDIDKATIKPESMGTLNMVVQVMKDNPDIKFEVDGHTDNTGTPAHNMTLSQQRSDAVKAQLIVMGIDASRLTSKGFGDTKPIADNSTLEGKANNRRVEFVKQ